MTSWREDPRLPYLVSAILGMIAGVAAKQAVTLQSGRYPKPLVILADFLVLGMVLVIVMYLHAIRPKIPLEGIALISGALAMWGPRGIAALLTKFKAGALDAAQSAAKTLLEPVEPVQRPTVAETAEKEREEAMFSERENEFARRAPMRRMRQVVPLEDKLHADELRLISELDKVDPNYRAPSGTKKENEDGQ